MSGRGDALGASLHFVLLPPKPLTGGGPPAQTASHADFFHLFHRFPSFSPLLWTYISLRHISLLSKYDYNRRILFEWTAQMTASQATTCEATLSEESLPPAPSQPSPSSSAPSSTSTCSTAATVSGCASTGPDRQSAELGWSKAQSVWASVLWETQWKRQAHGAGRGDLCVARRTVCSCAAPLLSCCCSPGSRCC